MDPYRCLIITIFYDERLLRCALKVDPEKLPVDCIECWIKEENKYALWDKLPLHVKSCGQIVDVQEIFEISDLTN